MTGRGIDQALPHPSPPRLHEPYVKDAQDYVALAERIHGSIPQPVDFAYIWGDAWQEWARMSPDMRLINLETSITTSEAHWRGKGIHYRMHPANVPCLVAARIDCCALANNHTLDWGYAGLRETITTLRQAQIRYAGAGQNLHEAEAPAVMEAAGKRRVVVFACGTESSGIPLQWTATAAKPGVNLLPDLSNARVRRLQTQVQAVKRPGDIVVVSIHWGGNWGYDIPPDHTAFAHQLIDEAGVDVIHGHSSHHVKGIDVYKNKLILYGCGDLLTDYEGISGHEAFRGDLSLMYFPRLDLATGELVACQMSPMRMHRFQLQRASPAETLWLRDILQSEGQPFGTGVAITPDHTLTLKWHDRR
jgi:poly-gamma-glutamate capsule biosynthesis protein CapA/YwtB (metallophosphatase superfamily)